MSTGSYHHQSLEFRAVREFKKGLIYSLINDSYQGLLEIFPLHKEKLQHQWQTTDDFAFENKDTPVADCFFITCLKNIPIGMGSFDPRNSPESIEIGQNCILPEYRGNGFGKMQLLHILQLVKQQQPSRVQAVTNSHAFFLPAQRMYLSCGFQEKARFPGDIGVHIRYEMNFGIQKAGQNKF